MRVDMHMHTCVSFDCLCDPEAVLDAARSRGIDRICITDHNDIDAAVELNARHPDAVIVGEEVKTREGVDVIGLFIRERIPKRTPALETCERIHDQGGIVYVPHPFVGGKGGGGSILAVIGEHVDAIEAFNARVHLKRFNDAAVAWGREHDVPLGAGSDAHTLAEVGRAYVEVPAFEMQPQAFLAALRQGSVHGTFSSWAVHGASTWAKIHKRIGLGR